LAAVRYALPHIEKRSPIESWILDDTGMLKQRREGRQLSAGREPKFGDTP
jgi:hypothetical protein